jgi:radical SAM superfamily enzyme YgiQ (UPF0313 family)
MIQSVYGEKTWKNVDFKNISSEQKKNRIIGMSFPRQDTSLGLEPSILTVLPDGDNVEYDPKNRLYNDADVKFYLCSVYISGYDEFVAWALQHDKDKIVVGGYQPTTFPEEFTRYAFKVVRGPCDNIWETLAQMGQVVDGICTYDRLPRRDLYDLTMNQQIIPDKEPHDMVVSINTSLGCSQKPPCDFCCTPIMCPKLISKPIDLVMKEAESLAVYEPKFCFIRDENFTMQPDWKKRLFIIHDALPETKIYLFASANTLSLTKAQFMADHGVYMVCLGLEDPTKDYAKNRTMDNVVGYLKSVGIYTYLSFIVDPLAVVGREEGETFYKKLMERFHELKPEMVCGNFLMPFRGTGLWDRYYQFVGPEDYKHYDSKTPFLVRNPVLREKMKFWMFHYQWEYFTSDFYQNNVRKFDTGDTLHLRFTELYDEFKPRYDRIWNVRA